MKKVLISEKIDQTASDMLTKAGFDVQVASGVDEATLTKEIQGAYALILRSSKLPNAVIDQADQLKIISRTGTGVDNVDIDDATKHQVLVARVNGANAYSVAEYVITQILTLSRRILKSNAAFQAGKITNEQGASLPGLAVKNDLNGHEVRGKRLAILGLGRIGRVIKGLAQALGMDVVAYDPYVKKADIPMMTDLDELYRTSDFISVNMPLTPETKNMISKTQLAEMKSTAFVINAGRGGIVNERDLAAALNAGEIAGAALDVFATEPPKADNPMFTAKNAILTAHIGGTTVEAMRAVAKGAAQAVIDYANGKEPEFTVNYDKIKH
ncbi:hydroxyacid dehydrogenase [Lactiplantibacillus modestisalitolerans]|uniref:Hydroxyacid dehydrogenase n=1 Tax=Lactiplantibacillus modestisalitolerans TaxID=1457219 RepID=A0ABV5WTT4_9LACO|nr:hydroxyacid dehydrogenase [Lactiplantibacillus modestisalitolerans]